MRRTPLVFAPPLNCWLKLESLQATGSFKLRGAAMKLSRMAGVRGVVAASAGNHGQGVALAAARLGIPATVVVPTLCPAVKREAIARYGALGPRPKDGAGSGATIELIVDGANYVAAEKRALALAAARGLPFVSPFDDDDVIAGNGGWLGREIAEQHAALSRVIVPVGGGGLVAGLLQALPDVEIVGVQPRANCAMHESLALGRALLDYEGGATLCEGLEGAIAERTFAVARARRLTVALVDEEETLAAIGFAWRALGLVVEPSAAVALAAARTGRVPTDEDTVIVVTGSNIDPALLDRAIAFNDRSDTPRR